MKSVPDEPLRLPLIPHRKTGFPCDGSIVAIEKWDTITLECNQCGAVVGMVPAQILKAWKQAIADQILMRKFEEADAPEVLTSISEECQRGECAECSGIFHRPDTGDWPVFCVHDCHQVKPR